MAEIIINDIEPINFYTAAGGELGYDYDFPIFDSTDLKVLQITDAGVITELVDTTDHTISGVGLVDGGSIVFDTGVYPSGAPAGYRYVLYRDIPVARANDFLTGGDFKAVNVNRELDKIIMMIQQNELEIKRSIGLQKGDSEDELNLEIQTAAERANRVVIFGASGNTVAAGPTTGNVDALAAIIADISTVAGISSSVTAVAGDAADIGTVASNIANVNAVGGSISSVNNVATNIANVNSVAGDATDIGTVATNIANVNTTADNIAAVNTAATNIAAIIAAPDEASAAATSASNALTSENNAADSETNAAAALLATQSARDSALAAFDNFDDVYLGAKASDPTVDNDGDPLTAGDLYYNTTDSVMKIYTGSIWVAAYVSGTDFLAQANNLSDVANASSARTNLGLAIGTNVQAYHASLQSISGLTTLADRMIYTTAANNYAVTPLTSVARTLLDDTTTTAMRSTLGLGTAATTASTAYATAAQGLLADSAVQAAIAAVLTNKTLAVGGGNDVQTQFKVGSFTRDISTATGTQAVTGVGFQPRLIVFLNAGSGGTKMSIGFDDGTSHQCLYQQSIGSSFLIQGSYSIVMDQVSGSVNYLGLVSAFGADGFTVSWTKTGAPTGTAAIPFIAIR